MKTTTLLAGGLFAAALLLSGCSLNVGPSSPHPNVMVRANDAPAALVLDPSIQESFVIPRTGSINPVNVTGWRTTLENAFHNAFPEGNGGRKLEILQAELGFSPRAVSQAGTAAVSANIRFKARLVSATGDELGVLAATAQAREAVTNVNDTTANAAKAVEAMYEMLASEMAVQKEPVVESPRPAPAARASTKAKTAKTP
jgi:uncharacterized lipoprotein YbaY